MNRLILELARTLHRPSLASGYSLPIVRVLANVSLQSTEGWTTVRKAIIDTGAAVSLIPNDVWRRAKFDPIVKVRTAGVVNRPECTIPATLASVNCLLLHGPDRIGPLPIHALLADSDRVPLLLGVSGILDRLRVVIDISNGHAVLESD